MPQQTAFSSLQTGSMALGFQPPPPFAPLLPQSGGGVGGSSGSSNSANSIVNSIVLDITKIPVGNLCNIVRAALKLGQPKYKPVDLSIAAHIPIPHTEPGRLEIRVNQFYKALSALRNPTTDNVTQDDVSRASKRPRSNSTSGAAEHSANNSIEHNQTNTDDVYASASTRINETGTTELEGWERHVLSAEELAAVGVSVTIEPDGSKRGYGNGPVGRRLVNAMLTGNDVTTKCREWCTHKYVAEIRGRNLYYYYLYTRRIFIIRYHSRFDRLRYWSESG
jgi:hypothetical protein